MFPRHFPRNIRPRFVLWAAFAALAAAAGCAPHNGQTVGAQPQSIISRDTAMIAGPVRTVVVDAGHGGEDPGASYFGFQEKMLALDLAKRLRAVLELSGVRVIMTRETDQFIPLSDRPAVAGRAGADAFVSIHLNANRRPWVSGLEVYCARESEVGLNAAWPPGVTSHDVVYAATTIRQLAWDLVLRKARAGGQQLGADICQSLRAQIGGPCVQKAARFVVLREAWMASVLVEAGYLSNHTEAMRLGDERYRDQLAQSIGAGIVTYLRALPVENDKPAGRPVREAVTTS